MGAHNICYDGLQVSRELTELARLQLDMMLGMLRLLPGSEHSNLTDVRAAVYTRTLYSLSKGQLQLQLVNTSSGTSQAWDGAQAASLHLPGTTRNDSEMVGA